MRIYVYQNVNKYVMNKSTYICIFWNIFIRSTELRMLLDTSTVPSQSALYVLRSNSSLRTEWRPIMDQPIGFQHSRGRDDHRSLNMWSANESTHRKLTMDDHPNKCQRCDDNPETLTHLISDKQPVSGIWMSSSAIKIRDYQRVSKNGVWVLPVVVGFFIPLLPC